MSAVSRMIDHVAGDDPKMRRLITYWGATVLLYVLSLSILWVEVLAGAARRAPVVGLTVLAVAGHSFFYVLIRLSKRLDLAPAQLSVYQGRFAVVCTVAGYSVMGPLRGASLVILLVILVFCAFTLEARKTHALSVFALTLLGLAMLSMKFTAPELFNPKTELIHFTLSGSMLLVVATLTGRLSELRAGFKAQNKALVEALAHIQMLATRDELTALPNRRYMIDLLDREWARRIPGDMPPCLALLDIDWFKKINDSYGHAAGDAVLRAFSQACLQNLRANDVIARWGGEEFLLYLPHTQLDAAITTIERLRDQLRSLRLDSAGVAVQVTFSAGLIELGAGEPIDAGIQRADAMLYQAKADGRDRIVACGGEAVTCLTEARCSGTI
ncbi:MAG TPA: GGDEF domain-containing protein [Noviherbaspirillum sp.]|uniref:GGDEF domain-containing protein n=1 Tax=Noviherbaspirillum sp. TaxID=1926288 RepID=UPI002D2264D5|nr:GGDEF domain-containing protein [Noviherbaspirillum sp.]HYD97677.1 GGDEF domain-containing protein [Noviherbaspirillum sp.]